MPDGNGKPSKTAADEKPEPPPLKIVLQNAAKRAVGGGVPGALAMVIQVLALMWMRTTINYQHSKGLSTRQALAALYAEGGLARFYRGLWAALLQAPLSRFGDTAANAGMLALLETVDDIPVALKTFAASCAAALYRISITPIDTVKTLLQVQGPSGMAVLSEGVAKHGVLTMYEGALGSSFATLMGHYPWFITYNWLQKLVPPQAEGAAKLLRSALIGFCCSFVSDCVSNSVRVVKTAKQTSREAASYFAVASQIVAQDGIAGLLFRGLGTKLLSNGLQAMLFTVCWRYLEEKLNERAKRKLEEKKAE